MKIVKFFCFATIAFFPFYVVRCKSFLWCVSPVPFTFLEVLILLTFALWFSVTISNLLKKKETVSGLFERLRNPFIIPGLLLVGAASVSLFFTPDLRGGLGIWKAYFIEPVLLFVVVIDLLRRERSYLWVLVALLISGVAAAGSVLIQFLYAGWGGSWASALEVRTTGLYNNPNAPGLFLGPVVALAIGLIIEKGFKGGISRLTYLSIFTLVISVVAVLLSHSRGGLIGLAAIFLFWVGWWLVRKFVKLKNLVMPLFIFAAFLYLVGNFFVFWKSPELLPKKASDITTLTNRYCLWRSSIKILQQKPLIGAGLDGFHEEHPRYKVCSEKNVQYPHNLILNFWVELGLLGLVSFLIFSFVYGKTALKNFANPLSAALLSGLVYSYVHGLVDVPYFKNDLAAAFWVLAALVCFFGRGEKASQKKQLL